jgi:5-methyltetrahydropteroyltriglutamate--homocysteine methyltransferase
MKPPFRADQVGSLLRPARLIEARAQAAKGAISAAQLRAIEDDCIREAVALQESIGLQAVTDGEFRRAVYFDFLGSFEGIEQSQQSFAGQHLKEWESHTKSAPVTLTVTEKIRRPRPIAVADFEFLRSLTTRTAKVCIPAPTTVHRGQPHAIRPEAYRDHEDFWSDFIAAYRAELADLSAAGCTYLQFDEVIFAYLCDDAIRDEIRRNGEDPDRLPAKYVDVINRIVARRPPSLAVTMHTCRGNFRSTWRAAGAYDPVAEAVFGGSDVDGFFLEFDSDRAGSFEPLRYVAKGKRVVLGLVSTKVSEIESKDELKRRVDQAAKYVPIENLCLSPQCGFASNFQGNLIGPDVQRRKLELVVETAAEIWGNA